MSWRIRGMLSYQSGNCAESFVPSGRRLMSHRGEPGLAPFWQGMEAGRRSQFGQEILTVWHLEVPARRIRVNVLLSRDVGHGDEKVVSNLEVGEELQERRDNGVR